jgi:hypothetical protein
VLLSISPGAVRFARKIHRRVRALGGASVRAAFGGDSILPARLGIISRPIASAPQVSCMPSTIVSAAGTRMMGRQERTSNTMMRLWEPHDPGGSCLLHTTPPLLHQPDIPRERRSPVIPPGWVPQPLPRWVPQGVRGQWSPAWVRFRWSDAPLRYVGVRPIDSAPIDGPPSSAHDERNSGRRPIGPALWAGRAFARNLRKPVSGCAATTVFHPAHPVTYGDYLVGATRRRG